MKRGKRHIAKNIALVTICIGVFFLLVSGIYLFTDVRTIHHYYSIRHISNVDMIQNWMTLHYISNSFAVPEQVLLNATHTTLQQSHHQSLSNLAKTHNESAQQLIATIRSVILQYKAQISVTPTP
ncbi:MAG TPA: hypothetical protein VMR41_04445 [Patescibacteria group bacterium]|nr:hypothetical protein [Patescibacteria group bacterium]